MDIKEDSISHNEESDIVNCSFCKGNISTDVKMELSHWNEEPICSTCKNIQCCYCGKEGNIETWYLWTICEECSEKICNKCDGDCNDRCLSCERSCDYDCDCSDND